MPNHLFVPELNSVVKRFPITMMRYILHIPFFFGYRNSFAHEANHPPLGDHHLLTPWSPTPRSRGVEQWALLSEPHPLTPWCPGPPSRPRTNRASWTGIGQFQITTTMLLVVVLIKMAVFLSPYQWRAKPPTCTLWCSDLREYPLPIAHAMCGAPSQVTSSTGSPLSRCARHNAVLRPLLREQHRHRHMHPHPPIPLSMLKPGNPTPTSLWWTLWITWLSESGSTLRIHFWIPGQATMGPLPTAQPWRSPTLGAHLQTTATMVSRGRDCKMENKRRMFCTKCYHGCMIQWCYYCVCVVV